MEIFNSLFEPLWCAKNGERGFGQAFDCWSHVDELASVTAGLFQEAVDGLDPVFGALRRIAGKR